MHTQKSQNGFTLIEAALAVAIIGILGAVAWPLYQSQSLKNSRTSAISALAQLELEVRQCYSNRGGYDCCNTLDGVLANVLGASSPNTADSKYSVTYAATNADATITNACKRSQGFTITATPINNQTNDTCALFSIDETGQRIARDSSSNLKPSCWGD